MALIVILCLILAFTAYLTVSYIITDMLGKRLSGCRGKLISLYVERANLMPGLMNAARKHSPIPQDIYLAFVDGRDRFAAAGSNRAIREANEALDKVFTDFFSCYDGYGAPKYQQLRDEYDKLSEKISFNKKFYESAADNLRRMQNGLCRPAVIILSYLDKAIDALRARKWRR